MKTKKPTQLDVAKLAGVSRATVSYIINENAPAPIPEKTQQRVWSAINALGYVPNQQAQHLRKQATKRICVAFSRLGVPYNDRFIVDFQRIAKSHDYSVIINICNNIDDIKYLLQQLRGGLADGLFLEVASVRQETLNQLIKEFRTVHIPKIVMGNIDPTQVSADVLRTDPYSASYRAVQYLIEQGHHQIGFLGHFIAEADEYDRFNGYQNAMTDAGLILKESLIIDGAESRKQAYHSAEKLLDLDTPPTAIFCTADIAALSVIAVAHERGMVVPQDLAVIGTGNIPECEYSFPKLTSIGPVNRDISHVAELLISRMEDNNHSLPSTITQEWDLILRDSTRSTSW